MLDWNMGRKMEMIKEETSKQQQKTRKESGTK